MRHHEEVNITIHHVYDDPRIGEILRLVRRLTHMEEEEMADLTALTAEVEANTSVTGSVAALVARLADEIAAIPTEDPATQAAIDSLVASLHENDTTLGDLVVANTPPADQPPADGALN